MKLLIRAEAKWRRFCGGFFFSAEMHILLISEVSERKLGSQIPFGGKWFSPPSSTHQKKKTHTFT